MLHPQPRLFDSRHALFEIDNLGERRHDREIVAPQGIARHRRHRASSPSSRVIAVIGNSTSCLAGGGTRVSGAEGALWEPAEPPAKRRKVCGNCCNHTKSPASEPMTAMTRDDGDLGDIL